MKNGDGPKSEGLCIVVRPDEDGMTARGALKRSKGVSGRLMRKIAHSEGLAGGALYINGAPALFRDKVAAGDELRLVFPEETSWIRPCDVPLAVLYEDDDIIVINKEPGMVVHPTKGHRDGTLANAIIYHMQNRGENYKPRFISRLDMDTSGILLVGKNSHAQDNLAKQGAAGCVEKIYTAVLTGRLEDTLPPSGVIDLPVGLLRPGEPSRAVIPEEAGGCPSQTEYEVTGMVCRVPAGAPGSGPEDYGRQDRLTIVRARLITGRTHQIRVHFAHFGHPVLGDSLYGQPSPLIARQALHASEISFAHPATGQALHFEAPLPPDITAVTGAVLTKIEDNKT